MADEASDVRYAQLKRVLEGPDDLATVPARYLSAPGFALRLLRLLMEHERAGTASRETLFILRHRLADVAVTLWPDDEEGGDRPPAP